MIQDVFSNAGPEDREQGTVGAMPETVMLPAFQQLEDQCDWSGQW